MSKNPFEENQETLTNEFTIVILKHLEINEQKLNHLYKEIKETQNQINDLKKYLKNYKPTVEKIKEEKEEIEIKNIPTPEKNTPEFGMSF